MNKAGRMPAFNPEDVFVCLLLVGFEEVFESVTGLF